MMQHGNECPEQRPGVARIPSLDHLGHDRGGRHRNTTTGALEGDFLNAIALDFEVNGEFVTAKRIGAGGLVAHIPEHEVIPCIFDVIHNQIIVWFYSGHGRYPVFARCCQSVLHNVQAQACREAASLAAVCWASITALASLALLPYVSASPNHWPSSAPAPPQVHED